MNSRTVFPLLCAAIPALVLLHLHVAPYTKVEESFHIQAVHDILAYGIPTRDISDRLRFDYDHFTFPGAVPRTFLGAVVLSGLSQPVLWLNANVDKQMLARAILGLANAGALVNFAIGVRRAFGWTTAVWYLVFQASQFHVIFYASRTLSNMFAFVFTTVAMSYILPDPTVTASTYRKRCLAALYLLTLAGIIFRAELALFLATTTIYLYLSGHISIQREILPAGLLGLVVGLTSTVTVDSYFWQQFPLWPELSAFKFNVLAGQASAWGVHPWHFYFTNAIPRLLLNPLTYLVCIPFAISHPFLRQSTTHLLLPSLAYTALYSIQPHKEWRFIIYILPPVTAAASLGASFIWTRRRKSHIYRLVSLALVLSSFASLCLSTFILLPASAANYPGAHALRLLQRHAHNTQPVVNVYLGNLACQTGVTRFLGDPPRDIATSRTVLGSSSLESTWRYDKTENIAVKKNPAFWTRFDYALVEAGGEDESELLSLLLQSGREGGGGEDYWSVLGVVDGFAGLRILGPGDQGMSKGEKNREQESEPTPAFGLDHGRGLGLDFIMRMFTAEGGGGGGGGGVGAIARDMLRKYVTRGWWAEVKMEPKIKILKHWKKT